MEKGWTTDRFTVTFANDSNLSQNDMEKIFSQFSKNVKITNFKGRIFAKFSSEIEAQRAVDSLSSTMDLHLARKRSLNTKSLKNSKSNNSSQSEGLVLDNLNDISAVSTYKNLKQKLSSSKAESVSDSAADIPSVINNADISPPHLIDIKNVKKMHPIIVANLPETFTLEDVLNLVEESEPLAVTQLQQTKGKGLRFCEIYLRTAEDVSYLKNKLDGFVIAGKKLLVVESSECLSGLKWIL